MLVAKIENLEDMANFAQNLAQEALAADLPPILLCGPLGSGKTTLASCICKSLPGGDKAEISSPSFTVCNFYPCVPQVLHCDFYRCGHDIPEEVWNFIDNKSGLLLAEWAESLRKQLKDYLDISFNVVNHARWLKIDAKGRRGLLALKALNSHLIGT